MIQRVHDRLKNIREGRQRSLKRTLARAVETVVVSNVSIAVGAALMAFANATLAGFAFSWEAAYIAGAYLFSMHVLNRLNDVQTFKHNEPEKIRFYLRHRELMTGAALAAAVSALGLSFALGPLVSVVVVGALVLGLGYTVKWFPKSKMLRIHRLKDIPASKDIFVGVAWAVVTAAIPALAAGVDIFSPPVAVAFAFTFGLVYIRSVLSDIRDIRGDRLVGRETIPIIIGGTVTKVFLAFLTVALAVMLVAASVAGWAGPFGYLLALSVVYTATYLVLYHRGLINNGLSFDLMVDGVFHFTGLSAIVWVVIQ